jgi:hypothetical protein
MLQLANTKQPFAPHGSKHEQLWDQAQGNASHIQIEFKWFLGMGGQVSFATSTGEGHSCLVQECYDFFNKTSLCQIVYVSTYL